VQESELDNLLDLAETLQIMGLCHIRKKYVTSGVEEPVEVQSEVLEEMVSCRVSVYCRVFDTLHWL
jgi:hypothetical protein